MIVIIDYGLGNLGSILNMLKKMGEMGSMGEMASGQAKYLKIWNYESKRAYFRAYIVIF